MDPITDATEVEPTPNEKAVFYLKSLIELIESDRIAADRILGMTANEVISLAEDEAAKAVENSANLATGN